MADDYPRARHRCAIYYPDGTLHPYSYGFVEPAKESETAMTTNTPPTTPDPFERLTLACVPPYHDRQAVACIFVMSVETRRAFQRHTPRYAAGWPEDPTARVRQIAAPFSDRMADVDIDEALPYGVIRARFEVPGAVLPEHFWREFTVLAVGER